jgi:O-antigen/teichoic acid export membrane protein
MISRLKPISANSQNILTLMAGTTLSQAIPIAIMPVLTRIYTPEDFGLYAIYGAIITILGTIASGRYELAILLPEKDEDAINIFALGILITIIMVLITSILIIICNSYFILLLNNQDMKYWLYFVPISVFIIGCQNLLLYFNNRLKNYKVLSKSFIIKSSTSAVVQSLFGFIKQGVTGLISGQLLSQFISDVWLLIIMYKSKIKISSINRKKIIEVAKRYRDFPKYSILAILANKLTNQLSNIVIFTVYSVTILGLYSHVQRVLGLPSALIGSSIGRIFFYEANKEKQQSGKSIKTLKKTIRKLLIIGIPIFGVLFFIVEDLFAFVFGEPWRMAGQYAQIAIPYFFIQFVVSSISSVDTIMEKQNLDLIFNVLLLVISLIVVVISSNYTFKIFLINWTISISLIYSGYGYLLIMMSKGKI